ncbi:MAG TPA: tRNA (adenosine(37)-N6)-threonylcarbamoyltransferase complex ATPase subunit type 1 TsaE [Nitriliruptorales bacterium]|nr:tRNA (adenosine(37)-N6)-threonylcarbamoyltransferase complex ATPase subunit type 1 TsaE [Nitriliruptorales bacterium]
MTDPTVRLPAQRHVVLRTAGQDDTRALAAAVARHCRRGDVISLTGELGAGKTTFVQGAAAALGVRERVTSPTFMLVRPYRVAHPSEPGHAAAGQSRTDHQPSTVVHVDVYRLDQLQDVVELGEDVIMGSDQVTFVEWGDAVDALLPSDRLEVELLLGRGDDERDVHLRGYGDWTVRMAELAPELTRWSRGGVTDESPGGVW